MIKTLVVGGGIISSHLIQAYPNRNEIKQVNIRNASSPELLRELLDVCIKSKVVVYLAYHHRNIYKNISLLQKILHRLSKMNWQGQFIFFNTQSLLLNRVSSSKVHLANDMYILVKKIQSKLLAHYASKIWIDELFLPLVTGPGSKWDKHFLSMLSHRTIFLPKMANNQYAYLDLEHFVHWFWNKYSTKYECHPTATKKIKQIFVYEGLTTFFKLLEQVCLRLNYKINPIKELHHKYRYDSSIYKNIFWLFKLSYFGVFLSLIKGMLHKDSYDNVHNVTTTQETTLIQTNKNHDFVPVGSEYQFYLTSFDLNRLSFQAEKVTASSALT